MDEDDLLDQLFLHPPLWDELLSELAPSGWASSSLTRLFHPTLPQVLEEAIRLADGLRALSQEPETPAEAASRVASAVERMLACYQDDAPRAPEEPITLVGWCVWDLFVAHIALRPDGQEVDLGSWRGAAGAIADWPASVRSRRQESVAQGHAERIRGGR